VELKGLVLHDRYRIYEQDGAAGMATVCLARDVKTSAVATVLVLEPPVTRDSGSVRRFLRSAEMAARLNHPYVAPIEDYGQEQGVCYMVTRYDQQATLRDVEHKSGTLSTVQCAWITACIASALEAAVASGIAFHGALRPDNIIITASGDAQVAGFGIAAASGAPDEVLGKGAMHYAAPEQVEGRTIDVRTDLYALGVMVYEMLTGHVPSASDAHSFLGPEDVAGTSDRMDQFLKDVPERLRPVLSGLLAWDPDARFASPGDLIETLVLGGFPAPQRPSTEPDGPDLRHGPVFDASSIPDVRTEAVSMVGMSELYVRGKNGAQRQPEEPAAIVGSTARAEIPRREEGAAWETGPAPQSVPSTSSAVMVAPPATAAKYRKRRLAVLLTILGLIIAAVAYAAAAGWLSGGKPAPGDTTNSPTGQTVTTGKLDIKSTPSGASIMLDSKSVSPKTPAVLSNVAPGSHTVLLRLSGYVDSQQKISVTAGSTSSIQFTLEKKPSTTGPTTEPSTPVTPSQVQTTLRVTSTPAGAAIAVDGKPTGKWTPSTLNVTVGSHTVSLSLSGYKTLSKEVSVVKGQHASVSLTLTRTAPVVSGLLRVTSTPAGATVKVDGKAVAGRTPLSVSVSVGSHALEVSLQGYETWLRTKVDVVKGIETVVVAQLVVTPVDKSYVSATSGFGFHYPATWTVQDNPDPVDPLAKVDVRAPSGASVRVSVVPVGNATLQAYMESLKAKLEKEGWVVSVTGSRAVGGVVYKPLVATRATVQTEYCMLQSSGNIYQLACTAEAGKTTAKTSGFPVILGSFFAAP
jgi:hypothetical protein